MVAKNSAENVVAPKKARFLKVKQRDQAMINHSTRSGDKDTAAQIQVRPVTPDVIHASDARDRLTIGQTPR